jgi:hypothetical protein
VKGEVVYLYAFDVANEIVTARVREVLSQKPVPYQLPLQRTFPRDVPVYKPLAVEPPPLSATLNGKTVRPLLRIYDVGVVSVAMRSPFEVEGLLDLMPAHQATLDSGLALDKVALDLCNEVCKDLRESMVKGRQPTESEAYTVFCVKEMTPAVDDVNRWLAAERRTVAGLLTETNPDRLSEGQVSEVLRIQRSFEISDLVVIDWDAALVVDLTGPVEEQLYAIELANLQLEEFRVMDQTLDRYFNQVYEDLEASRWSWFGRSTSMLHVLRGLRVDLTKLADEVAHFTKFFGDWYLARVYLGARDRFHLDHWRQSVEQRLAQLDQLYSVFHSEVYEQRMYWLEIIIVLLFVIDLIALFMVGK